ncbi:MAG TPA: YfhO family protein [Ferruginibacter sp.]|nr:YfhO family protein [Ferruginibacter sp.]
MKKFSFKIVLPHIVAFIVFLSLSLLFTSPVLLDGKVVEQHDTQQWKAMAEQSFEYKTTHGYWPRWTNSMFGGMPAYQIVMESKSASFFSVGNFSQIFTVGLPKPVYFLFLICACFYLLCIVIGINPWLSILGGIAYGYCSYNPIIIAVGHDTKFLSMAYAPAILASMILIFKRKYWSGGALLLIFSTCFIEQNHQQILYYTMIIAACLALHFIIQSVKDKDYKHLGISLALTAAVGVTALLICSPGYFATYEYSKETMRSGSALAATDKTQSKTGLDKDYAFQWSYGKSEALTFIVPNAMGGGSSTSLGDDSKVADVLQQTPNLPQQLTQQLYQAATAYWGEQPFTSGPVYFGAIICLLFLIGAIVSKSEHKWWILAATIIGVLLAFGKNFESLNYFLFDHLPFYNKFRTPAMALVIPQLTVPLLAVIFVNELVGITDKATLTDIGKKSLIVGGSIAVVLAGFYFMASFKNEATGELQKNLAQAMQNNTEFTSSYISALIKDRQAIYLADMWRTLGFVLAGVAVIFLYTKQLVKPAILYIALILLTTIDLTGVGKRYLNDDSYVDPVDYETAFKDYNADIQIKRDPSFFRVLNLAFGDGNNGFQVSVSNTFNDAITSYKHNSIGGYHPAKLSIYEDLKNKELFKNIQAWAANPQAKDSFQVLNMLNMKYVIVPDQTNPKQTYAIPNPYALGNCWLIKDIRYVDNADEEMSALDSIDPAKTAVMNVSFKSKVPFEPAYDSLSYIHLIKNDNDDITYDFNSSANQFAVFSEIYYDKGWQAYIDGKQTDYCKVDYVLRGLAIPAGKHSIEFKFDSKIVDLGEHLSYFANIIGWLFLLLCGFMIWKDSKKTGSTE